MTVVGAGGICIKEIIPSLRFKKDYKGLDSGLKERVNDTLRKFLQNPFPPGIRFEKLKGYKNPDIYTVHVTGNLKISIEIKDGNKAILRRVALHDQIDFNP